METEELVKKLQSKDLSAFDFLYDRYSPTLYMIIKQATPDDAVASKILHHVFIKIYLSIGSYHTSKCSLLTWMLRITINQTKETLQLTKEKCLEVYGFKKPHLPTNAYLGGDYQLTGNVSKTESPVSTLSRK
jgi:DNA-directed RNA polymerase specialized sigma24 family protein